MTYLKRNFSDWKTLNESSEYYHDTLNQLFWEGNVLDKGVSKKLLAIAKEFYSNYDKIAKNLPIIDIQLTGSLANYNYTEFSDLDIHVLVDFSKIDAPRKVTKAAFDGIRFIWNTRHNIKIRGHEVELYIQDSSEPHTSTGLYSIMNNEWIKEPKHNEPNIKDSDVEQKYRSVATTIEKLESKLLGSEKIPSNSKDLYKLSIKTKDKILKMRKEALAKGGEFSVGNLSFKKLRNNGYIGRLIDLISKSYDRIYSE